MGGDLPANREAEDPIPLPADAKILDYPAVRVGSRVTA
jgi:hypothetical protein